MTAEIVQIFTEMGYQVHPDAVGMLKEYRGSIRDLIRDVLGSVDDSVLVIGPEHIKNTFLSKENPPPIVLRDVTGRSGCIGNYDDFVRVFRDRYSKLSRMIRKRMNVRTIESIKRNNKEVSIVGIVSEISRTSKGNTLLRIEDLTGNFPVIIKGTNTDIVYDEVIGVSGSLTPDGNLLIAENVVRPEIPSTNKPKKASRPVFVVFISDIHV
ncbi:MAG: DNA-directed DNA polymerase II small subunit, partial [Candidatus Syntropharchaeia archaeon]